MAPSPTASAPSETDGTACPWEQVESSCHSVGTAEGRREYVRVNVTCGCHATEDDYYLLKRDTVQSGTISTFQKNILPPFSGPNSKPRQQQTNLIPRPYGRSQYVPLKCQ